MNKKNVKKLELKKDVLANLTVKTAIKAGRMKVTIGGAVNCRG